MHPYFFCFEWEFFFISVGIKSVPFIKLKWWYQVVGITLQTVTQEVGLKLILFATVTVDYLKPLFVGFLIRIFDKIAIKGISAEEPCRSFRAVLGCKESMHPCSAPRSSSSPHKRGNSEISLCSVPREITLDAPWNLTLWRQLRQLWGQLWLEACWFGGRNEKRYLQTRGLNCFFFLIPPSLSGYSNLSHWYVIDV